MKLIFSIFLSSVILLQSFSSLIILGGYELNKEYITRIFCKNKDKPVLHCNGKCYLENQLTEHQKKEQSPNSKAKEKHEILQFCEKQFAFQFISFAHTSVHHSLYVNMPYDEISFSIFHPPSC
ncbi:MAG: hypothetical protein WBP41_15100 [Saprospiraceae bacterium]